MLFVPFPEHSFCLSLVLIETCVDTAHSAPMGGQQLCKHKQQHFHIICHLDGLVETFYTSHMPSIQQFSYNISLYQTMILSNGRFMKKIFFCFRHKVLIRILYLFIKASRPFRRSSIKSSSNIPSSFRNGSWRPHAFPGKGGTTIYKAKIYKATKLCLIDLHHPIPCWPSPHFLDTHHPLTEFKIVYSWRDQFHSIHNILCR